MTTITPSQKILYVSPPGDTLLELLDERGFSVENFANQVNVSVAYLNDIILGKLPILEEFALKLEQALSIPASFWNAREQDYQEALAQQAHPQYALEEFEAITVYAFLETLRRLTSPLPLSLQQNINQLRKAIITDTKTVLNTTLRELVKDSLISPIYQQIRSELNQNYRLQEACSPERKKNTSALSDLLNVFVDIVEAPSANEEAKVLAPELDRLFKCLF
jgi:plasmid maintenance system antidote protein VapI